MEVQNIRDARCLHLALHGGAKALEAIERLALEVFNGLGDEAFQKVFGKAMPKHDFCDVIRREMTEFQTEKIPESYFAKDEQTVRALVTKASYWAKCYEEFDDLASKIDWIHDQRGWKSQIFLSL